MKQAIILCALLLAAPAAAQTVGNTAVTIPSGTATTSCAYQTSPSGAIGFFGGCTAEDRASIERYEALRRPANGGDIEKLATKLDRVIELLEKQGRP